MSASVTAYRATFVKDMAAGKDITKGPKRQAVVIAVSFAEAEQKALAMCEGWELVGLYKTKEEVIQ